MNGDLRLVRRRWWGSWAILAASSACLALLLSDSIQGSALADMKSGIVVAVLTILMLCCYAPWTFFPLSRVMGLLIGVGFGAFLVHEADSGGLWGASSTSQSVTRAVVGCFFVGLPAFKLALTRRPEVCPYDERGRALPIDCVRTLNLDHVFSEDPTQWGKDERVLHAAVSATLRPKVKFELRIVGDVPPRLEVVLPVGRRGESALEAVRAELERRGIRSELGPRVPGTTYFRTVFEAIFWFVRGGARTG